jgi:acyl-CoA synthetase (AMP-forming)/AMP-acid ligase II
MAEHEVTGFAGVPSTFALLLHRSNLRSIAFPQLRYVTQAGGAMPPAHIIEWLKATKRQVPFYVMYGTTEASARLTYLPPELLEHKLGSIGIPIPGVTIDVITEDGRRAPPGCVGELVARGENISSGYWNAPAETARRFEPNGYRTGDLGYADDDGYLFLVGRRHDLIKTGAHRVSPAEIENVLHRHPAVHEAAVIGYPDELLGEVPLAFAALRDEAVPDENVILKFCAEHLAGAKIPKRILFVADLPKSSEAG